MFITCQEKEHTHSCVCFLVHAVYHDPGFYQPRGDVLTSKACLKADLL